VAYLNVWPGYKAEDLKDAKDAKDQRDAQGPAATQKAIRAGHDLAGGQISVNPDPSDLAAFGDVGVGDEAAGDCGPRDAPNDSAGGGAALAFGEFGLGFF
jgi:hypothetical protein